MNEVKYSECCGAKIVGMYLDEYRCSMEVFICTKCGKPQGTTYKSKDWENQVIDRVVPKMFRIIMEEHRNEREEKQNIAAYL